MKDVGLACTCSTFVSSGAYVSSVRAVPVSHGRGKEGDWMLWRWLIGVPTVSHHSAEASHIA